MMNRRNFIGGLVRYAAFAAVGACAAANGFAAPSAEILWTKPICVETNRYIGWPTVCCRANGELLAVFSGDRDEHVDPYGKVQMVRSKDGGETWSEPVTIRSSSIDDRDAGIIELRDGTLLANSFSSTAFMGNKEYRRHNEKIPEADIRRDIGYWSFRSTDGGKTWEPPVPMRGSSPHGGVQLRDGRVFAVGRRHNAEGNMFAKDPENVGRVHELVAETSADGGRSWTVLSRIEFQDPFKVTEAHEPHVAELSDGTLVAQFRYHGGKGCTLQCESHDGGKTWGKVHETGILGYPSHLLLLQDGRLLSTFSNRSKAPWVECAVLSTDGGKTWDVANTIVLSEQEGGRPWDMGYPATAQLRDGTLVTVYYQVEKPHRMPCLMATKRRLVESR